MAPAGGTSMPVSFVSRRLGRNRGSTRKLKPFIVSLNTTDLLALTELVEAGKIKPSIDRRYALRDTADALRHVGEGHAQGQTVIHVSS